MQNQLGLENNASSGAQAQIEKSTEPQQKSTKWGNIDTSGATRRKKDALHRLAEQKMHVFMGKPLPADALDAVHEYSDIFFAHMGETVKRFALQSRRNAINEKDAILYLYRFTGVTDVQGLFTLVEKHMPDDARREMIPSSVPTKKLKK